VFGYVRSMDFSTISETDRELFARPLIAGASVSADWASLSPGKRLSYRYTDKPNVVTVARSGHPSLDVIPLLTDKVLSDRSIIVGFDLFFWDSVNENPQASIDGMKALVAKAKKRGIPVVFGDIPELLAGHQPGRAKLNKALRELRANGHCVLVELDELHRDVMRHGGLKVNGRLYTLRELVPDGLHIGDVAGEFLADLVHKTIRGR
jgi:hypothetical protein